MSDYFAKREAKAVEKARKEAQQEEKETIALRLLGKLSLKEIAECSGLTLKKVQMLAATL